MITKKTLALIIATGLAIGNLNSISYGINQVEGLNMEIMEDEEVVNTYSYEELLDLAMKNSSTLIRQQKQIERNEILRDEAAERKTYTPAGVPYTLEDAVAGLAIQELVLADNNLTIAKRQLDVEKDKIAYDVKKAFNNLILAKKQLSLDEANKELSEMELRLGNIQYQQGVISQDQLQLLNDSYQEALKKLRISEEELQNTYLQLNNLAGLDRNDRYHIKTNEIEGNNEIPSLEPHIRRVLDNNPNILMLEQRVKLLELALALHTYNVQQDPYEAKEIDLSTSKMTLSDSKEMIELSLRNMYHTLQKMNENIDVLIINKEKLQRNLDLNQLRLDIGMATPLEVKKLKKTVDELEKQILELQLHYEETLMIYEKPWVVSN